MPWCRCKDNEFNANGQLFFQPLLQAMRIMIHFGETMPDSMTDFYQISGGVLLLWSVVIFVLMLATFGIGAATGAPRPPILISRRTGMWVCGTQTVPRSATLPAWKLLSEQFLPRASQACRAACESGPCYQARSEKKSAVEMVVA